MRRNSQGFTLIELMLVIVVIGILAAIAIPNFIHMQDRAREGAVKGNMHVIQLAIEDFAVQNDGTYPVAANDAVVQGDLSGGVYPENPFNNAPCTLAWAASPGTSGDLGMNPAATVSGYTLEGYGKSAMVSLTLSNGS